MALHLPTVADPPQGSPCAGCAAPCCVEHEVPLDGRDLLRLLRGLAVPWEDVIELDPHEGYLPQGFRLDDGDRHHALVLRRARGACALLLELPGGHRRCGAYELRPAACRVYPLVASPAAPGGSFVSGAALCPDENRPRFAALRPSLRPLLEEDQAELRLAYEAAARWNAQALRDPAGAAGRPAQLVRWLLELYGALESLRGPERGDWQLAARALIRSYPLPQNP